jgi:O-antigen/teichoic acid export membrane protein
VTFLSGTVLFVILGRVLDVKDFGTVCLAMTISATIALLPGYGFELFTIRELSQGVYDRKEFVSNVIIVKFALTLVSIGCLRLYITGSRSAQEPEVFWLVGIAAIFLTFTNFFNALQKAHEDFCTEALANIIQCVLLVGALVIIAGVFRLSTIQIAWLILLSRVASLVFSAWSFWKQNGLSRLIWFRFDYLVVWKIVVQAFPFALQAILGRLYFQVDTIIIGELLDATQAGYYQAGMRLLTAFMLIPSILMSAFYPRIAQSFAGSINEEIDFSTSRLLIYFLAFSGSILTIVFSLGASPIIMILYTAKMSPAIPVLRVLSLVFVVRFVAGGYGLILISSRHQRIQLIGAAIALVVNVGLNLFLVPRYGFIAAAWTSVITNVVVLAVYLTFTRKEIGTFVVEGNHRTFLQAFHYIKGAIGSKVSK